MDDIENIKIKVCDSNASILEAFRESRTSDTKEERVKGLRAALERAEEAYKNLKGLRNVPSDILDYEVSRLRVEYNLFMLYVLNNQIYDAKKTLDKLKFNPTITKIDNYKQRKLIVVCLNLAITYITSNKNDINAFDNGTECFEFVIERFFDTFQCNDEHFAKFYAQMISVFICILNNDKDKIKKYMAYANKIILYKDADGKLDASFSKLYSDLALNFAKVDFDISKNLLDKALEVLELAKAKEANELVVGIIYNNYAALFNRYTKYRESIECRKYSVDLVQQNLDKKKDNKFLKFQLSDSCYNIGYAYSKLGELENMDENYDKAKEQFWTSYAQAKDIFYVANQYESLEVNATIDSKYTEKLLNSLEYFNQALKIYNKSIDNKTNKETDEINKRLNNKIRIIQAKINETQNSQEANVDDKNKNNEDDVYERPKKISKIRSDVQQQPVQNDNQDTKAINEEHLYSKVTVKPERSFSKGSHLSNHDTETGTGESVTVSTSTSQEVNTSSSSITDSGSSTNRSSSTTATSSSTTSSETGATVSRPASSSTKATSSQTTKEEERTDTSSIARSDTTVKSTKSKREEEAAFDRMHYESTIQQLVRQNLVKKRPEVAILYPDFNRGKVPKNAPSEGSQICTIL